MQVQVGGNRAAATEAAAPPAAKQRRQEPSSGPRPAWVRWPPPLELPVRREDANVPLSGVSAELKAQAHELAKQVFPRQAPDREGHK